jgi:hypothetical protein
MVLTVALDLLLLIQVLQFITLVAAVGQETLQVVRVELVAAVQPQARTACKLEL